MREERLERLRELRIGLPDPANPSIEDRARQALAYVLDRILEARGATAVVVPPDPRGCPNCGQPTSSTKTPYCGEVCRETAGFVRQFRTGLTHGWMFDADRQVAMGQVLWHVLGGGRPLRQQIAPVKAREKVLKREHGRCEACGAPATTVDHVGSGCNRPINLRAVCDACCADRPFGDPKVIEDAAATILDIAARIGSGEPIRCCDDAGTWDWRAYLAKR